MEDASLGPAPRRPAIVKTGDSADFAPKDAPLRNQPQLPRLAHRLGPPPRAQLFEQPRHMGLHRVGRHVQVGRDLLVRMPRRSEEHTSELQSLMRSSSAVFCLNKTTVAPTTGTYMKRI